MTSHYYWEPVDTTGFEHCTAEFTAGLHADGLVLGVDDEGEPFCIRYRLDTDEEFRTRSVRIDRLDVELPADDESSSTNLGSLSLSADGDGSWTVDGESSPELDGCLDVDVAVTPFTNALPIRRLGLAPDESATTDVVYLDPRTFDVSRARQRYTCLASHDGDDGGRYRYESLTSGFTAAVSVDSKGVVRDYPSVFRRVR